MFASTFSRPLLLFVLFAVTAASVAADEPPALGPFGKDIFPLGVWLQRPEHADRYKNLGINLYVGLWHGPTAGQLAVLKKAGMPVVSTQNEVSLADENRDIVVGWLQQDEPDNAQPLVGGVGLARAGWGAPVDPSEMMERYRKIRARDSGRPVVMNLGKGVAWDAWKGRGNRTSHPEDYLHYVQAADILSFDIYPAAETDSAVAGRLDVVAYGVERLVRWAGPGRTVWNVIGASRVNNPNANIAPEHVHAQVWMSIIAGSRGIIYFVHQFEPKFVEASVFENPGLAAAMKKTNAQVQRLGRAILSPATDDVESIKLAGVDGAGLAVDRLAITTRRFGCSTHVFAASLVGQPVKASIRLRNVGAERQIAVIDENRTLVHGENGFVDNFAPYGVHLYTLRASQRRDCETG